MKTPTYIANLSTRERLAFERDLRDVVEHHALHGEMEAADVQARIEHWLAAGLIEPTKLYLLLNRCAFPRCRQYISLDRMEIALECAEQPRFCAVRCRQRMHAQERRERFKAAKKPTYAHVRPSPTQAGEIGKGRYEQPARRIGENPLEDEQKVWISA
jgi:hypothetical protein